MYLPHCMIGWTVLTVLSVSVPVWSSIKVTQPYKVVSTNGTAQFHCIIHAGKSPSNLEDLRVTLLRGLHGNEKVCSSTLNISEQQKTTKQKEERQGECAVQIKDGVVEVGLSGLKATHTDIYRCEIQIFYPPPYLQLRGNGTLLHVLESSLCPLQGPQRWQSEEEENDEIKPSVSAPVVVLVTAIICVLVIIITLQARQCERERIPPNVLLRKVDAVPFSSDTKA